ATIPLSIGADSTFEPDEIFTVVLSGPVNATISTDPNSGVITIGNDDIAPGFVVTDASASELTGQTGIMTFLVSIPQGVDHVVTVDYTTLAGSAADDLDFTPVFGTLTFQPGETSMQVDVPILDDDAIENEETFTVVLSSPQGLVISDGTGTGTIFDEDGPVIFGSGGFLNEGISGQQNITFTFYMLKAQDHDV